MRNSLNSSRRLLVTALLTSSLLGGAALARSQDLPATVDVAGQSLTLAGQATQKKLFFEIYDIGLYLNEPVPSAQAAVASDQVKQVHIRMLRSASREQVVDALKNGFVTGNGAKIPALEARLDKLLSAVPDVKKGHELIITYVPGKGTTLEGGDGRKMEVKGKDFSDALLNVWLGKDPGTRKFQRELLENV